MYRRPSEIHHTRSQRLFRRNAQGYTTFMGQFSSPVTQVDMVQPCSRRRIRRHKDSVPRRLERIMMATMYLWILSCCCLMKACVSAWITVPRKQFPGNLISRPFSRPSSVPIYDSALSLSTSATPTSGYHDNSQQRNTTKLPLRLLVIDHYDSFTYNLVDMLGQICQQPPVVIAAPLQHNTISWNDF